jgi:hypothetical protein
VRAKKRLNSSPKTLSLLPTLSPILRGLNDKPVVAVKPAAEIRHFNQRDTNLKLNWQYFQPGNIARPEFRTPGRCNIAWGNTLYNPSGREIPPDVEYHGNRAPISISGTTSLRASDCLSIPEPTLLAPKRGELAPIGLPPHGGI